LKALQRSVNVRLRGQCVHTIRARGSDRVSPAEPADSWIPVVRSLLFGTGTRVVNIVGIGNPIKGDDGVGLEIVSTLRRELGPSPAPSLRIHSPSLYPELLISRIARSGERIVIIDAVEANMEPGAIVCSGLKEAKFGFFATHNLPLKILPEVAENLDESYVVGVQPESVEVGEGLSEKVRAASNRLVVAIIAMIEGRE